MSDKPKDIVDFSWRDDYDGLYGSLRRQRSSKSFVNPASRTALAIMQLHCDGSPLTVGNIVEYVQASLAPRNGWKSSGPNCFDRAKYEQLVWTVIATLKQENPGQALIYVE